MTDLEALARRVEECPSNRIGNFRNDIGTCSVCGSPWLSVATLSWDEYRHRLRCMKCWALGPARRSVKRAAQLYGRMWKVTNGERIRQVRAHHAARADGGR